jgi:DNA-directed RNA polymerase specialized sigma24 family protein
MSVGDSRRGLGQATSDPLAMALAGDERALDALLRPMLPPAYRIAYMMLRDREAAEDAVQNAALKSWRKLARLRPGSDPLPWFLAFVANECRNSRRSRWRSVIRLGERDDVVAKTQESGSDPDLQRALGRLAQRDMRDMSSAPTPSELVQSSGRLKAAAQRFDDQLSSTLAVVHEPASDYVTASSLPNIHDLDLAAAGVVCWPVSPVECESTISCD